MTSLRPITVNSSAISIIPNENLIHAFSHLDDKSACRAERVCKAWNSLLDRGFWKELCNSRSIPLPTGPTVGSEIVDGLRSYKNELGGHFFSSPISSLIVEPIISLIADYADLEMDEQAINYKSFACALRGVLTISSAHFFM